MKITDDFKKTYYEKLIKELKEKKLATECNIELNGQLLKGYLRNKDKHVQEISETNKMLEIRQREMKDLDSLFLIINKKLQELK